MTKQTYDNYYRHYFKKNRKRIKQQNSEYNKNYQHEYYLKKKTERLKYNKEQADLVNIPENPRPIERIKI